MLEHHHYTAGRTKTGVCNCRITGQHLLKEEEEKTYTADDNSDITVSLPPFIYWMFSWKVMCKEILENLVII